MTKVAVIVPTVDGREQALARCVASHAPEADSLHVLKGYATCGAAWNVGALLALSDVAVTHVLLSADDLVASAGWRDAALTTTRAGELPAPMLYDEQGGWWNVQDGAPGSLCAFPRVPFLPRGLLQQLLPIPPIHYYSDCWVGARAADFRWKVRVVERFAFTHTWAQEGRIHDSEPDRLTYEAIMARS